MAATVFACFALGYLLSYLFRTTNAVIAPVLRADLSLSDADLGLLSAAYYLSFALMQIPLGIWLDKYGPRRLLAALMFVAAAGSAVFAMSDGLWGLWTGRAMIGMGVSACLMAAFKAFRLWYNPRLQGRLASLMSVAGAAGALLATVPVNFLSGLIGWRGVFWVLSVLVLISGVLILVMLRAPERANQDLDKAASQPAAGATSAAQDKGYKVILAHPYFRRMLPFAVLGTGTYAAMHTLWAGPWMTAVLGLSSTQTANVLFLFNFCLMFAHLGVSWMAPKLGARSDDRGWTVHRVVWAAMAFGVLMQALMVIFIGGWSWIFWVLLSGCLTITMLVQVNIGMSFPATHVGRANSAFNFMVFAGSFVMQWCIGLMSDGFQSLGFSHADGLRGALLVCTLLQVGVLAAYLLNKAEPGIRD